MVWDIYGVRQAFRASRLDKPSILHVRDQASRRQAPARRPRHPWTGCGSIFHKADISGRRGGRVKGAGCQPARKHEPLSSSTRLFYNQSCKRTTRYTPVLGRSGSDQHLLRPALIGTGWHQTPPCNMKVTALENRQAREGSRGFEIPSHPPPLSCVSLLGYRQGAREGLRILLRCGPRSIQASRCPRGVS